MHRLTLVQSSPEEAEVAVLRLSNEEHEQLHAQHEGFINHHQVFCKNVRSVTMQHESHPSIVHATWISVIVHYPHCMCVATCIPAQQ